MEPGEPLSFISGTFDVNLCTGEPKNFFSCNTWELFNLTPTEIADIPGNLFKQYGITPTVLTEILAKYGIQNLGREKLDAHFKVDKPPVYVISTANHYSWPKSAALTGIGSDNLLTVGVDDDARMDVNSLRERLTTLLGERRPVYSLVLIAGKLSFQYRFNCIVDDF